MQNHEKHSSFEGQKIGSRLWGLAPYFLVQRDWQSVAVELEKQGLSWQDYYYGITPDQRAAIGYEEGGVDADGFFVFPKGRLILGHTSKRVKIPRNRSVRMRPFFVDANGVQLELRTNCNAPTIHPGSEGAQTYEILNVGGHDLRIMASKIFCPVDIYALDGESSLAGRKNGHNFTFQEKGKIRLGNLEKS